MMVRRALLGLAVLWFANSAALRGQAPANDGKNQLPSLAPHPAYKVTITGPEVGYVDYATEFMVRVVNTSQEMVEVTDLIVASPTLGQAMVRVESLKPGEARDCKAALTFEHPGRYEVGVYVNDGPAGLPETRLFSFVSHLAVRAEFNPRVPVKELLPPPPRDAQRPLAVPGSLAEVPEVFFEQPLERDLSARDVHLHTVKTIERSIYLNQKKTDGYLRALIAHRSDLAGLPFAMGDACRWKAGERSAFGDTTDRLRTMRRNSPVALTAASIDKHFSVRDVKASPKEALAARADIAGLMQVLAPEATEARTGLARYLKPSPLPEATLALAKLAIFSEEDQVRGFALAALAGRPAEEYTQILLDGLRYPWPEVAERASFAIAELGRTDLLPELVKMREATDPRSPREREDKGKKVHVVRELVRINHHRNCMLCHAPGTSEAMTDFGDKSLGIIESLTAPILQPNSPFPSTAYYKQEERDRDILVRVDVTYLRQDFSMMMKVADAMPWPEMQRFDFVVREREISAEEARRYEALLHPTPGGGTPYQRAAEQALARLTARAE